MSMIERSDDRTYQDFLQQVTALVRQSRIGVARSRPQLAYEILRQAVAESTFLQQSAGEMKQLVSELERMLMLNLALLEGEQDG